MDAYTIAATAIAAAALILAIIVWRQQQRRRLLGDLAALPARVLNPRLYQHLKRIRTWQLEVEQPTKACTWARESRGKRFRAESSVPVPIAGCGKQCRCRYQAVTENRRGKRRVDPIDQPELNMSSEKGDRRQVAGRRKEDNWRGERRN